MTTAPLLASPSQPKPAMTAIACGQCRRPNPPARKFCGECGHSLWEKCGRCSADVPPQERFCGECGCDVRGLFEQRTAELAAELREAEAALNEHRYDDARLQLRGLQQIGDPRFAAIAQRAAELLSNFESKKAEALAGAEQSLETAKQLLATHDYERAAATLAQTPVALRSEEMQALLKLALAQRDEAASLAAEIRAAVADKQYSGLLPKVDRLLMLKPDHAAARKLAEQLRDHWFAKARRALAEHQYDAAVAALAAVPTSLESEEMRALADKARELACLATAVRTAPLADETALAIAQRFAKVAASNAEVMQLVTNLQTRAAQPPADKRLTAPDGAPPPRRTALGVPVDWLGQWTAYGSEAPATEVLTRHPGRFAVAIGLALEGLGASAVSINHLPHAEKPGLLRSLTIPLGGKRPTTAAWGLDLSPSGLKAIKLTREARSGALQIAAADFLPHAKTLTNPETELEQRDLVGKTLQAFVDKHAPDKNETIVGGIAGHQVLGRFFELPPMPVKKVASAVEYEARHQFPIPPGDLAWGYAILNSASGKEADGQPRRVVLSAARQYQVAERAALFQAFGIKLDALQSDCLALHNAVLQEFFALPGASQREAICLLDVGVEGTNFVISSPQGVWFRSVRQGTHDLVSLLVKELQLTYPQAELLQREPHRARRLYQVLDLWQPWIQQLASEAGKSQGAYAKLYPQTSVSRVYGLGGGFRTFGLLQQLRGNV